MIKENTRTDWLLMIMSFVIIGGALLWVTFSGTLQQTIAENPQWTWHFIRATGSNAFVLLSASVIWGLFLNSQLVKNWSPGPISIAVHSAISWLALALTALHMGLLLLDKYLSFQLLDLFIPFTGPYRPEAVGLGSVALYIILLVNLSFAFKKQLGNHNWKRLHYLSYASFALVVAHAWFAGTDANMPSMQVLLIGTSVSVVLLLGVRLGRGSNKMPTSTPTPRSTATPTPTDKPHPLASESPSPVPLSAEQRRAEAQARAQARRAATPSAHPLNQDAEA